MFILTFNFFANILLLIFQFYISNILIQIHECTDYKEGIKIMKHEWYYVMHTIFYEIKKNNFYEFIQ